MDDREIIEHQKEWISRLTCLNKNKQLIGQYMMGRPDDFKKQWIPLDRDDVILTRQILNSELVFDFDCKTWAEVRKNSQKLVKFLDYIDIPYILAYSGGKGIHVHIFMDVSTLNLYDEDGIVENVIKYNIDVARVIRKTIFDDIIKENKLAVVTADNDGGLDTGKVYFSLNVGKGSMIRDFGCFRSNGKVKSVITNVPHDMPEIYKEDVVFPADIRLASIVRWSRKIENAINDAIYHEKAKERAPTMNIKCHGREVPCYRNLLKGVDNGMRNVAVFSLGRIGNLVGNSELETLKDVEEFCENCNYNSSEAEQTVHSAYRYDEIHRFCKTLRTNFGKNICDYKNCPLKTE